MRTKLIALALVATVAIGTGGIVAANSASPDAADTHSSTTQTATVDAGGYAFVVSDQGNWFAGDRADDHETVAHLLVTDDEVGDRLRTLLEADQRLRIDVYGSLQSEDDSAHVRVYPDRSSATGDPRPLLEATVDLGTETVELVGVSTEPVEADDVRSADESESVDFDASAVPASPDGTFEIRTGANGNGTTLVADSAIEFDVSPENVTRDGDFVRIDLSEDSDTATVGDAIEIVDESDELTDTGVQRVRDLVANDTDARATLRDRFGDDATVRLAVDGVGPSGDVYMDATAPGDGPETVVVANRANGRVSVESAHLLTTDQSFSADLDDENLQLDGSS